MYDYICHHGVKGMKWGVRRYQNYDGTRIRTKGTGDVALPKGHKLERVYTEYNTNKDASSDNFKSKRLYVSDSAADYLNDYFVDDVSKTRVQMFKTNKKLIFAGEESVNKILKEIGEKPLNKVYDERGYYNKDKSNTDRDFLMNDAKIGEKFIKKALSMGYSGIRDPVDDTGIGYSFTAKILFDKGGIDLISDEKWY